MLHEGPQYLGLDVTKMLFPLLRSLSGGVRVWRPPQRAAHGCPQEEEPGGEADSLDF